MSNYSEIYKDHDGKNLVINHLNLLKDVNEIYSYINMIYPNWITNKYSIYAKEYEILRSHWKDI
jgi:hypothetical protein